MPPWQGTFVWEDQLLDEAAWVPIFNLEPASRIEGPAVYEFQIIKTLVWMGRGSEY